MERILREVLSHSQCASSTMKWTKSLQIEPLLLLLNGLILIFILGILIVFCVFSHCLFEILIIFANVLQCDIFGCFYLLVMMTTLRMSQLLLTRSHT